MKTAYSSEKKMYPHVVKWLREILQSRHKKARVDVWDCSATSLSRIIDQNDLTGFFPSYLSFEIQVDIVGAIVKKNSADLMFVECKLNPITLRDLGQLLGYCRVAKPSAALLLSPSYISEALHYLLKVYERNDVLYFAENRTIRIARWDASKNDIEIPTLIPPGQRF